MNGSDTKKQRHSWLRAYGFSIIEIAEHMGLTRERVRQLCKKGSPRITTAVSQMREKK